MGAAYSQDLRDRVLGAIDRGMSKRDIADVFAVSPAWVLRVKQRRREFGETTPRPSGGRRRVKIGRDRLAELARAHPDATLKEFRSMLGVDCAESAICTALKKLGFTYKKGRSTRRSRVARMSPSVAPGGVRSSPSVTPAG